ncbi:MAG: hypothetical protein DLM55_07220 [Acidimicrobiales bacterium]|nr:MAG: hypothetical protein DLM55_07220 [Acidimicrobiales bacterium]
MGVTVRQMRPSEWLQYRRAITQILRTSEPHEVGHLPIEKWKPRTWKKRAARRASAPNVFFVAVSNSARLGPESKWVGTFGVHVRKGTKAEGRRSVGEIVEVWVDPEHRGRQPKDGQLTDCGQPIVDRFMDMAAAWARYNSGVHSLVVKTDTRNKRAQAAYARNEFEAVQRHPR